MTKPTYNSGNPPAIDVDFLTPVATLAWDLLGDGTNAPTSKTDAINNIGTDAGTIAGGWLFTCSADSGKPLTIEGFSATQSGSLLDIKQYSGRSYWWRFSPAGVMYCDNSSRFETNAGARLYAGTGWAVQPGSDSQAAFTIQGHSTTQTADLIDAYKYSGATDPSFSVDIDGNIFILPQAKLFSGPHNAAAGGIASDSTGYSWSVTSGSDTSVPWQILGHSSTQSANLFEAYTHSGGSLALALGIDTTLQFGTFSSGTPTATGTISIKTLDGTSRNLMVA